MQVSFGPYALTSCFAKKFLLGFVEGNGDDCNGEIGQSNYHDKQLNLERGSAEKRRLGSK